MIPTIEDILKALFAGDMQVEVASRYIATHIEIAERRAITAPKVEPAHELPETRELSDDRIMEYLAPWHIEGDADDRSDIIACVRAMLAAAPKVEAPVARAEGDVPAKPTWGYAKTVGNAIAQLQTMDSTLPFYAALHLEDGRCIARGVTFSRERVVNERWIDSANKDVPYSIVVWSQPVESLYAATPKAEPPASGLRAETDVDGGSLRLRFGRAISQAFGSVGSDGTVAVDPSDPDDIGGLVDSVMAVLRAETDAGGEVS